jgi:hypothetical protein
MNFLTLRRLTLSTLLITLPLAPAEPAKPQTLNLPYGPVTRLASPDGARVLFGEPVQGGVRTGPQLWIEDIATHRKTPVLSLGGTMNAAWSPDARVFAVADHFASDLTRTYIYEAATLTRWDTAERILTADANAKPFEKGHSYFDFEKWEDAQTFTVRFHGHTDSDPVKCFEFRYRITSAGVVSKLSEKVSPAKDRDFCKSAG